jgi:Fe-only nitrogenase accessory protein AnfO
MKIAVCTTHAGDVTGLIGDVLITLYERADDGRWHRRASLPLHIAGDLPVVRLRERIHRIVGELDGCRVLLSASSRGVVCALLHDRGFHTWTSEGPLTDQLDYVARREAEEAARVPEPLPFPTPVGAPDEAAYRIDLAAALATPARPTSREVLVPFFQNVRFRRLEVLCDHVPKWFERELDQGGIEVRYEALNDPPHVVRAIVCVPEGALSLPRRIAARLQIQCAEGGC